MADTDQEAPRFDLQSHSRHSDGALSPTDVVQAAAAAGVRLLALTDHDSVEGVREAQAAGAALGIDVVPAVEISVRDPAARDLHLLGYRVNPGDRALAAQLRRSRADREDRARRIVTRLGELGFSVDGDHLRATAAAGTTVGRPHIAEATFRHRANAARLAREDLRDPSAFLVAYLIEGTPGFVERAAPTVKEAIALIHGAGGVAVWAHPYWDISADPAVLDTLARFAAAGLDGVEAFYIAHTREQTERLVSRADALGLLTTGSADFHGPAHPQFNRFRAFQLHGLTPNLGPIAQRGQPCPTA